MQNIVYEYRFFEERCAEIELLPNGKYQVWESPEYGGDYHKEGGEFTSLDEAIEFLHSLT